MILHTISHNSALDEVQEKLFLLSHDHKVLELMQLDLSTMEQYFNIHCNEEQQIRTVVAMFNYYSREYSKDNFQTMEIFLRKALERVHEILCAEHNVFLQEQEDNNLSLVYSSEMVKQLVVITWLFYEDEEERNSNPNVYSSIMDAIIGILFHFSEDLEKSYDEEKVINLGKIICLIKCEIHKDKDVVFLDILIDLFNKHLELYQKYRAGIEDHDNILNSYIQFLFEIMEAVFFYFLQPAKQKL